MQSLVSGVVSGFHATPLSFSTSKSAVVGAPLPRASDFCRGTDDLKAVSVSDDLMQLREYILSQQAAAESAQPSFSISPKPRICDEDLKACEPAMVAFKQVRCELLSFMSLFT